MNDAASILFEVLTCTRCGAEHDPRVIQSTCRETGCGRPLAARYSLPDNYSLSFDNNTQHIGSMWRWRALLPVSPTTRIATLGEGGTPLLRADRLGAQSGLSDLWIKDESGNPTGSFKARGLALAVTKAKELGARALALPTAGNAGSAAAAYAARAGIPCTVVMPKDTAPAFKAEVRAFGAELVEIDGLIDDCGAFVAAHEEARGWFDLSTFKEPYRVEGKKTLGFEIAEQLGFCLPDAVVYPTGGGTGLVAMWKAWNELEGCGLIGAARPRLFAVQAEGCAPLVRAFESGADRCEKVAGATTAALGLRVPKPFADEWILAVLRRSNGGAVAVAEEAIRQGVADLARCEGLAACPESGAALAGMRALIARGVIRAKDRVVVVSTGAGYNYR